MLEDRLAELFALQRIVHHLADQAFGDAGGHGGDVQAAFVQHAHRDLEALAFLADHVGGWHAGVLEDHVTDMGALLAHLLLGHADRNAGRVTLNHESRDALGAGHVRVGAGHDGEDVGLVGIGDVTLGAVEDVVIAVADGLGRQAGRVRAGFGLGQRETGDQVTRGDAGQPALFLRLGAEQDQRLRADADIRARDGAKGRGGLAKLERDEAFGLHVEGEAAILLRHGNAEQAERLHLVHDGLGHFVILGDFSLRRHAFLGHEAAHLLDQRIPDLGIKRHPLPPFSSVSADNLFRHGTLVEG